MPVEPERLLPEVSRNVDGCVISGKLQVHEVPQGQNLQLDWQMLKRDNTPLNLTGLVPENAVPAEANFDPAGKVKNGITLRIREITGYNPCENPIFTLHASIEDATSGLVRSDALPNLLVCKPGVYLQEWAVVNASNQIVASNRNYLWINRGLFGISDPTQVQPGPPSIEEIRLSLRDNSAADNMWLGDVEFDAAEIAQAVTRPVAMWNEAPPPLQPLFDTTTFLFRENWLIGIQAHLFNVAATHYRRNRLPYNAGGVAIDDHNKEKEYLSISTQLMQDYKRFVTSKKVEINTQLFSGIISSQYSGFFYR
jgi:hypothetical protein